MINEFNFYSYKKFIINIICQYQKKELRILEKKSENNFGSKKFLTILKNFIVKKIR